DLRIALDSGASQITGGSIAVKDPETFTNWISTHGPERIILGADARDEQVALAGWLEDSGVELLPFIKQYQEKGIQYVICTDISKDGMLQGPAFDLYRKILAHTSKLETKIGASGVEDFMIPQIKLIASGGISAFDELPRLQAIGCEGAIIGKAIYENRISLKQLEQFIISQ
ncbi:MAG: 1-(5-phosphoribosyl)-5-[(5-phosphoribosylamino)methylideneamino]imidazole-4-carboxamide isomerase, partial [Flavobacteriaceae bacterium]|nr:1-(5-phosphoribosyl)-5-[(5-phosphoribosylamino)methylideneamino]imidazole-4-carboxamide isomerase [Flavobacteriaceae bacterium]